jgi:hypothetical protein
MDFMGSRICFDAYVIPPTSLWGLSFPPLRFVGSPFSIFVLNGPTPLVFPLFFSSYEVSGFRMKIKGSY